MAKAPSLGNPKTRLQPPLTAAQARPLAAAFLQDIVAIAATSGAAVFVACTPPAGVAEVMALTGLADGQVFPQQGDGLSARCAGVFEKLFAAGAEAVMLLGADTPHLPEAWLQQAVAELSQAQPRPRLVLGPSDDGGYYLIGLRRESSASLPALLDGMIWSTATVCAETIARATAAGLEVRLLPPCYDIDTPSDLDRLQRDLGQTGAAQRAPRTRAVLQALLYPHDTITL
jgi:rSAM/selenodomain-associated transferase 1